ncbi:MAG: radical SAM protein [Magnetococcales bacterium]|nr:radical SAM protein [Magnetococcales bacterium]
MFGKILQKIRYGANLRKPRYMVRLAVNICKRRYLGQVPLRGVDFAVTYQCNLKCEHCFNKTILKGERIMALEDYARVIREAEELGALHFAFQGGEVLLQDNFDAYLKLVDARSNSLAVTTNGLLLTREVVQRWLSLGVNTFTISLDSGISEEHDTFRGLEGSFRQAVAGIDYALAMGGKVVINSTISPRSLRSEGFKALLQFAREKRVLLNTIFAAPSGKWANNREVVLGAEDIRYYNEIVRTHPFVIRDTDSGYAVRGCQAATESIYITPYGDVLPCPFIHISAGNVFEESLATIRKRAMQYFHYQPKCLIGESGAFIDQYIAITREPNLPLPPEEMNTITAWDAKV